MKHWPGTECDRDARVTGLVAKSKDERNKRAAQIIRVLRGLYPDAACALVHNSPLQLLVATILSAQCTDVRVNMVTPALFAKYPDADAFANADIRELEQAIQSTGFFRNKARNIKECCTRLIANHEGEVPANLEQLVELPGVGRKTANVVLGNCFETPGITVDTHVGRLSRRLGLTTNTDAVKVEHDLMTILPAKEWTLFSHRMIFHGRQVCFARKPNCAECTLLKICPRVGVAGTSRENG